MTSCIEKEIFGLEPALILSKLCAESILKDCYADLSFELLNSILEVKIMCFESRSIKNLDIGKLKNHCKEELNKVLDQYAPSIYREFIFLNVKNPLLYPKHYYLLIKNRSVETKSAVFNSINKLNSVDLDPLVEGIRVRVKGKKGTRKGARVWSAGSVSRHSNIKTKLQKYRNVVINNKGVSGVQVEIQYTDTHLRRGLNYYSRDQKEKTHTKNRGDHRKALDNIDRFHKKTQSLN